MRLTKKQQEFCEYYLAYGDLKKTAKKSGYRISRARENLENPRVLWYLAKMGRNPEKKETEAFAQLGDGFTEEVREREGKADRCVAEAGLQEKAEADGLLVKAKEQTNKAGALGTDREASENQIYRKNRIETEADGFALRLDAEGCEAVASGGGNAYLPKRLKKEEPEAFASSGVAVGNKAGMNDGDTRDFFIGEIQKFWYRIIFEDETADIKDKIKASELIAKTTGAFGEPKSEEAQKTVRIVFNGEDEAGRYGE